MSSEVKRVKLLTLLSLLLGLGTLVFGIVLIVMGMASMPVGGVVCADGFLTLFFGGRGALLANVPAKMPNLAKLAIVILILQCALIAAIVFLIGPDHVKDQIAPVVCASVNAVITLVILILARGIAKRAER